MVLFRSTKKVLTFGGTRRGRCRRLGLLGRRLLRLEVVVDVLDIDVVVAGGRFGCVVVVDSRRPGIVVGGAGAGVAGGWRRRRHQVPHNGSDAEIT